MVVDALDIRNSRATVAADKKYILGEVEKQVCVCVGEEGGGRSRCRCVGGGEQVQVCRGGEGGEELVQVCRGGGGAGAGV